MKPSGRRRKCLHCKDLFLPDYRNAQRQRYCLKPECRQARKRAAQQAWLAKPANQAYFRDAQNAQRVRDWQKEHPGYWRHSARYQRRTLQDDCPTQVAVAQLSAAEPPVLKPPQAVPPPALVDALPVVVAPPAIPLLPAASVPSVAASWATAPAPVTVASGRVQGVDLFRKQTITEGVNSGGGQMFRKSSAHDSKPDDPNSSPWEAHIICAHGLESSHATPTLQDPFEPWGQIYLDRGRGDQRLGAESNGKTSA